VLLPLKCRLVRHGNGSSLPDHYRQLPQHRGDAQWVPLRWWDTSSNIWANDSNHIVIPLATTNRLWLFFPKSTCKWMDHCTTCVGLQEGRLGVEKLLRTASPTRNYGVHFHHAGACGLPPEGQSIDSGMYPTTSVSLKHWGVQDFLPVCWGNSGSSARAPEAEYRCTPSQHRGGHTAVEVSPSS
jgi:hypothetical protein